MVSNTLSDENENENMIVYTYQTQQDVQKTTRDTIYFPNYIVTRDVDGKLTI